MMNIFDAVSRIADRFMDIAGRVGDEISGEMDGQKPVPTLLGWMVRTVVPFSVISYYAACFLWQGDGWWVPALVLLGLGLVVWESAMDADKWRPVSLELVGAIDDCTIQPGYYSRYQYGPTMDVVVGGRSYRFREASQQAITYAVGHGELLRVTYGHLFWPSRTRSDYEVAPAGEFARRVREK